VEVKTEAEGQAGGRPVVMPVGVELSSAAVAAEGVAAVTVGRGAAVARMGCRFRRRRCR
jgi:hypothetical protein